MSAGHRQDTHHVGGDISLPARRERTVQGMAMMFWKNKERFVADLGGKPEEPPKRNSLDAGCSLRSHHVSGVTLRFGADQSPVSPGIRQPMEPSSITAW